MLNMRMITKVMIKIMTFMQLMTIKMVAMTAKMIMPMIIATIEMVKFIASIMMS